MVYPHYCLLHDENIKQGYTVGTVYIGKGKIGQREMEGGGGVLRNRGKERQRPNFGENQVHSSL